MLVLKRRGLHSSVGGNKEQDSLVLGHEKGEIPNFLLRKSGEGHRTKDAGHAFQKKPLKN